MPIVYQKWITRADLRANPNTYYVFGDNELRKGLGGQAKAMRGEHNAVGVSTKYRPDMNSGAFFSDDEKCKNFVDRDLAKVQKMLDAGCTVVVPEDGIGTGLACLHSMAPRLDQYIRDWFANAAPTPEYTNGARGTPGEGL